MSQRAFHIASRREFVTLFGAAAVGWPLSAQAQQPAMPTVGYIYLGAPESTAHFLDAFRQGLRDNGYIEGRNLAIEFRWAGYEIGLLPELAADLVRRGVDVIATPGSQAATLAAKGATTTIPIVFSVGGDPVAIGLVPNLNRPGGNVTGIAFMGSELVAKRLDLLHAMVPSAARFALLVNPDNPSTQLMITDLKVAASSVGVQTQILYATNSHGIETAFESNVQKSADALLVTPDVLFADHRMQIVTLAARHGLPACYGARTFAEAGGLMSYGDKRSEAFRQQGFLVGRILKGEKPADLPVERPTRFEFVINLRTAQTLGLAVPPVLLAFADDVIE
jgi:putative tryptophan/tyrosine transport system substrate-binding protein